MEKFDEGLALPTEIGIGENYPVSSGRRGRNPFKNFHLEVDHQPSSFAPNSKWSNKGTMPFFSFDLKKLNLQ